MLLTNQTTQDYWFGPLHLAGGAGQTLTVDDTSATSLYLADDNVADQINNLYAAGKLAVSSAAAPFPRSVGTPDILHGDGSPEGIVYAGQGSVYLRRDKPIQYVKTTGIYVDTGWREVTKDRNQAKIEGLGYKGETYQRDTIDSTSSPASGDMRAMAVGLLAGDVVSNVLFTCVNTGFSTISLCKVGLWDVSGNLLANSANSTTNILQNSIVQYAFTSSYVVPTDGIYYIGTLILATTMGNYGAVTSQGGKTSPIGSYPPSSLLKASQSDIGSMFGAQQVISTPWFGWS